jgi:cytolysin-activating lysine-acyltransferase
MHEDKAMNDNAGMSTDRAGQPATPQQAEVIKFALEQAKAVLKKVPLLGPVSWLMMHSPAHKFLFVADYEWRIMPPIALDQAKLYMKDEAPLAFASWAFLSPEAAERYRRTGKLAPADWKSGDEAWLVDLIAPFGGVDELLKDLKTKTALAGKTVKMLGPKAGEEQGVISF